MSTDDDRDERTKKYFHQLSLKVESNDGEGMKYKYSIEQLRKSLYLGLSMQGPGRKDLAVVRDVVGWVQHEVQDKLREMLAKEQMAETNFTSASKTDSKRKKKKLQMWNQRIETAIAVLTLNGDPVILDAQEAVDAGDKERQHLENKATMSSAAWTAGSRTFASRAKLREKTFILSRLVEQAHKTDGSFATSWLLAQENPWYFDWHQVQTIPGLLARTDYMDRFLPWFPPQPSTDEQASDPNVQFRKWSVRSRFSTHAAQQQESTDDEMDIDLDSGITDQEIVPSIRILRVNTNIDWSKWDFGHTPTNLQDMGYSPTPLSANPDDDEALSPFTLEPTPVKDMKWGF